MTDLGQQELEARTGRIPGLRYLSLRQDGCSSQQSCRGSTSYAGLYPLVCSVVRGLGLQVDGFGGRPMRVGMAKRWAVFIIDWCEILQVPKEIPQSRLILSSCLTWSSNQENKFFRSFIVETQMLSNSTVSSAVKNKRLLINLAHFHQTLRADR